MRQLIFLFLFIHFKLIGQIEILNNSLIDPHEKTLYCASNSLEVVGMKLDSTYVVMKESDTLRHYANSIYYNCSFYKKLDDTIRILRNGTLIHSEVFQVKILPRPSIFLGTLRDTFVTRNYLLSNPGLIFTYEPATYRACSQIEKFTAVIIDKFGQEKDISKEYADIFESWSNKKIERYERKIVKRFDKNKVKSINYGVNIFNSKQIKQIKRMKKGEILWFKLVTISCPSCVSRSADPKLRLTLID